ncbi:hypothetical protein M758_9G091100 [Ceratodon purpureus]|nr:hypothetical protein M758_9G091100 [Ceratodon purpureus]
MCSINGKPVPVNSMSWVRRTTLHLLKLDDRRIHRGTCLATLNSSQPHLIEVTPYILLLYTVRQTNGNKDLSPQAEEEFYEGESTTRKGWHDYCKRGLEVAALVGSEG